MARDLFEETISSPLGAKQMLFLSSFLWLYSPEQTNTVHASTMPGLALSGLVLKDGDGNIQWLPGARSVWTGEQKLAPSRLRLDVQFSSGRNLPFRSHKHLY